MGRLKTACELMEGSEASAEALEGLGKEMTGRVSRWNSVVLVL